MSNSNAVIANVVEVVERRIVAAELHWRDGTITAIETIGGEDPNLPYLLPGFVDAHVHVESSMLTPCEFARLAVRHGTVAAVSDPHEIANVLGVPGVQYMLDNAALTPFKFCFGAPSCVPATGFETAGARLDSAEIAALFATDKIGYLSEVMNFPGVLAGDPQLAAKLQLARDMGVPIDGHAPGVVGADIVRYAAAGIGSDHECFELAEAEAKLAAGMAILIREGSAARNFDALHSLISRHSDRVMLCSDDKHPDDLLLGHINTLAARAVALGHDVFDVLQCACINPIRHYRLPLGQLRVGDSMDAVLVADLSQFEVLDTWIGGRHVASRGRCLLNYVKPPAINRFDARKVGPDDLAIDYEGGKVKVIQAFDGQLLTGQLDVEPQVLDGKLAADVERDLLWLAVVNRYQPSPPALALVHGFGLKRGALASSVAHDSHNIIAVACDADSLCRAVNGVIDSRGGIACAWDGRFESLPLPIAGLISDADGDSVAARYAELDALAKRLGANLRAPFMTLSFMALLVIPALKLSDRGLFDATRFQFTSLTV